MKLIKPFFTVLNPNDLARATFEIEVAARTCYKSESKIKVGSDIDLVTKLIARGHEAMLEFGPSIQVRFICDRGVSHELVRHRLCSFAQESTRYCNYANKEHIEFIIPEWTDFEVGDPPMQLIGDTDPKWIWLNAMQKAEDSYLSLSAFGWKPQQARSVLPNSLKTEIVVKANIREWRHIFRLRGSYAAHPQMRELMIPLFKEFNKISPILFKEVNSH